MTQEIIVYIIGGIVALVLLYKIWQIFFHKKYDSLCGSCPLSQECAKAKNIRKTCSQTNNKATMKQVSEWSDAQVEEWYSDSDWSTGLRFKPDASIDKRQFAEQAMANDKEWRAGFRFLKDNDLLSLEPGRYELSDGGTYATVSEYVNRDEGDFESHRDYIDIQYVASGREYIDLVPVTDNMEITEEYDPARDIMFFKAETLQRRLADPGVFLVLFPSDGHRPCMKVDRNEPVRKIVVKIPFAEL